MDYSMLEQTAKLKGVDVAFIDQLMAFSHWTYQVRFYLSYKESESGQYMGFFWIKRRLFKSLFLYFYR
jgi:hypothetical protein